MARKDMADLFNVSGSVTSLDGEVRQLRLPTFNQFPKLARQIVRPDDGRAMAPASVRTGALRIDVRAASLPEMTTDVLDVAAGYAVENVKRDRVVVGPWSRVGWGQLWGKMLGQSQRGVRP